MRGRGHADTLSQICEPIVRCEGPNALQQVQGIVNGLRVGSIDGQA